MAGAGLTKVEGERRVGAASAESADRLGAADARWAADQGGDVSAGLGDVMLEGARAITVDDWGGGRSRG